MQLPLLNLDCFFQYFSPPNIDFRPDTWVSGDGSYMTREYTILCRKMEGQIVRADMVCISAYQYTIAWTSGMTIHIRMYIHRLSIICLPCILIAVEISY